MLTTTQVPARKPDRLVYLLLALCAAVFAFSLASAQESAPLGQKPINRNPLFRALAAEQGVAIDSAEWVQGGLPAYAAQTGGDVAYGWRHDHFWDAFGDSWASAIVANCAARPQFYDFAPKRNLGYEGGGRPFVWVPEEPGDKPDGQFAYVLGEKVVLVTGPELAHFRIGPLFALWDHAPIAIKVPGGTAPSRVVAATLIRYSMRSLAGQVRALNGYIVQGRARANILDATRGAISRGCIDAEDAAALVGYVLDKLVPRWELPPQQQESTKFIDGVTPAVTDNPLFAEQVYNGLWWEFPALFDAWKAMPPGPQRDRVGAIVKRWAQYVEDLELLWPGRGVEMATISFPDVVLAGVGGKATPDWKALTKDNAHFNGLDWSIWGLRAQAVAAEVLGSETLKKSHAALLLKHKAKLTDPMWRAWFVDAAGGYSKLPLGGK